MKLEIEYNGFIIIASIGKYLVQGFKTPYETLREAKEAIDFMMEENFYLQ